MRSGDGRSQCRRCRVPRGEVVDEVLHSGEVGPLFAGLKGGLARSCLSLRKKNPQKASRLRIRAHARRGVGAEVEMEVAPKGVRSRACERADRAQAPQSGFAL